MEAKLELLNMLEANTCPYKRSRSEKSGKRLFTIPNLIDSMEQEIWKEFPEDLFEAVIARLPIPTLFRFRTVCRKWNSLISSSSFSSHFAEVQHLNPWFCTIVYDNINRIDSANCGAMYDPSLKKWHHPLIPTLRSKKIILTVASAGGLVCLLDINNRHFYICNPLIKSVKQLPPRSGRFYLRVAVGMALTKSTTDCGYKVVWLGCNGDYESYDSLQNCWTRQGSLPHGIKLPLSLNFGSQTVCIGSTLYFILN
ncbi:hypothetical protein HPP92_006715 [Vanilla planifolia]|uniref:F-box domain-containing protein n=1 Tax=Vanilla planifolia TaxID=51239 RepID=A0A835RPR9_VANPL|nr:hypothetical protein HPP92_006715 [Vanilla planifolia]